MFKKITTTFSGFVVGIVLFIATFVLLNSWSDKTNSEIKTVASGKKTKEWLEENNKYPATSGFEVVGFKTSKWLKSQLQVKDYDAKKGIKYYNITEQGEYMYSPYSISNIPQEGLVEIDVLVCVVPKAPEVVYTDPRFVCSNGVCSDKDGIVVGVDKSVRIKCSE